MWRQPKMRMRFVIVVGIAVLLVWEVVTRGGAAYLAEASPEKAIGLRAIQATALLNLADKKFRDLAPKKVGPVTSPNEASPDTRAREIQSQKNRHAASELTPPTASQDKSHAEAFTEIRSLAERALVNDPLNARALQILGQLAVLAADDKRAQTFMHAAVRRSLFESEAVNWMMRKTYQNKNYHAAIGYANTLLTTRPEALDYAMPVLAGLAENDGAVGELQQLLAMRPEWRARFFRSLPNNILDARTPLVIFLHLKHTAAPPTDEELGGYLSFLISRKFYDLAYYTWLQFLPSEQLKQVGNLFNGSFENTPSGSPFDWVWMEKPGVTIQVATAPDREGGRALYIQFGAGRVDFPETTELVMLPPGDYQLRGSYKADLVSQRGMQWRVSCAGGAPLGESSLVTGRSPNWQDFGFSFSVPKADCAAQYVTLISGARSASEQFISGAIWYDDLKIVNETVVAPLNKRM
jgi:hypothetical protein